MSTPAPPTADALRGTTRIIQALWAAAGAFLSLLAALALPPTTTWMLLAALLWVISCVLLLVGGIQLVREQRQGSTEPVRYGVAAGVAAVAIDGVVFLLTLFGLSMVVVAPWGRPLRVRGRQVHPDIVPGDDWAEGPSPSCEGLDQPTRLALATLWNHDAQKEHASVPAFRRVA